MTAPVGPRLSYPAGSITPHGSYYLAQGQTPTIKLLSWDGTSVFNLMGGENIPDYYNAPENVYVKDLKGLVPPWKQIDQKGATQDGRSFITSLYDPIEVELTGAIKGRSPAGVRKARQDLVAAIDAIQPSELSFFTNQLGRWWAPVRWMASPVDAEGGIRTLRQIVSLRLRAYDAFWRAYDVVDQFRISHTDAADDFSTDHTSNLGTGWTVALSGGGTGGLTVADGQVVPTLANGRTAVARRAGWTGSSPVVELTIGSLPQWFWDSTSYLDFWAMSPTGTPGDNGYRVRLSSQTVQLDQFADGVGATLNVQPLAIPPKSAESWTFVGGPTFKLLRSGALAYAFSLPGATAYTAAGFGLSSDGSVPPPNVRAVSFGTDAPTTQFGFVKMVNWGDQPMPPRFTCVGPGTFTLGDGPSATNSVTFGPLGTNQVAQVLTDARRRGVVDLSVQPVTTDEQNVFGAGLADLLGFSNLVGALIQSLTGLFGQGSTPLPPQGNLYSLMQGRFTRDSYIPPKPAGTAPQGYHIPVQIDDGTSSSQIIAAGTPLRRLPY